MCRPALLVVLVLLAGCTQTHRLAPGNPYAWDEVNGWGALGQVAVVELAGGETVRAEAVHVAPDVATWIDPATGDVREAPAADLVSVTFADPGRGALQGFGIGGTLGAMFGATVGVGYDASRGAVAGVGMALGSFAGGTLVGGLGALVGHARGGRTAFFAPLPAPDPPGGR